MDIKNLLAACFILLKTVLPGQQGGQYIPVANCQNCPAKTRGNLNVMNGSSLIATSYTMSSCGLDYVQASIRLNQRYFTGMTVQTGSPQPAVLNISGLPACRNILKAFLYVGVAGNGISVNASLTNPANTNSVYAMTIIGSDQSLCWSTTGTYAYRADVTSLISGNGSYTLSGLPTSTVVGNNDTDGATLFIVYDEPSQLFTGSIVIADGCQVAINNSPSVLSSTISGFNVCSTPSITTNFMLLADLQGLSNTNLSFNTPTTSPNFLQIFSADQVWNFIPAAGNPAVSSQTSAVYGLSNSGADCIGLMMAGMYYRTTCLTCTLPPQLTLTVTAPTACPANATVAVSGATAPYTYTWSGTSQSGSVAVNLPAGIYTVSVANGNNCSKGTATVAMNLPTPTITLNTTSVPVCSGSSVGLNAGTAASYTWSPGTFLNVANVASVISTPSANIVYTLNYTNAQGCIGANTVAVTVYPDPVPVITSNSPVCENEMIQLIGSGGTTNFWTGPNNYVSNMQFPLLPGVMANGGSYQLTVIDANSCQASTVVNVIVLPSPAITAIGSAVCEGQPASLNASGAITYTWTGPNNFEIPLQNIFFPVTNLVISGMYTVTATGGNSCTASVMVNLFVMPPPAITASNVSACEGAPATLTITGAASYSWTGPNGYSSQTANAVIPVTNNLSTGIYTVRALGANTCSNVTTVALSSLPLPDVAVGGATVCLYQTAQLNAAGAQTYTWSSPSGATSNLQTLLIQSANSSVPLTYTVVGADANLCRETETVQLVTLALPQVSLNTEQQVICAGESVTLVASGALNYTWMPAGPPPVSAVVVMPLVVSSYSVQGSDVNGCINIASFAVIVNTCTGINEMTGATDLLLIYPNPSSGNFTIAAKEPVQLVLINTLGQYLRIIALDEKNNYNAVVSEIAEGIYFLISEDRSVFRKIIIEK